MRCAGVVSLGLLAIVGCGDNAPVVVDMTTRDLATPDLAAIDTKTLCDQACFALSSCGDFIDAACSPGCQSAASSFLTCVRAADTDCNALAACVLTSACGGRGPTGNTSCHTAAQCEAGCNTVTPGPACLCGCVGQLDPHHAIELLVNNSCALARCASTCTAGPAFNGVACNACFAMMCADQNAMCQ